MKNTATATKTQRNQPANTSFDVSYAEILAEVQKLQQMLDGNIQTEKKQRKKRTLKSQVEINQPEPSMGEVEAQGDDADIGTDNEPISEVKASSHRYKVSNLDEIREKISEVKDLIEEADPAAAEEAQAQLDAPSEPKAQAEIASNVEAKDESQPEAKQDVEEQPVSAPQAELGLEANSDAQPESEAPQAQLEVEPTVEEKPEPSQQVEEEQHQAQIAQTTKEVVEENADNQLEEQAAIGGEQDAEPVAKPKKAATKSVSSTPKAKTTKEPKAVKEPKETKAKAESKAPTSDLDAYFIEGEGKPAQDSAPVGLAEERHAAQLAKHGVKDESEILKTTLVHDKSGTEWGGAVNLEDDPNLDHPLP